MKRVAMVCGSLQQKSANWAMLQVAETAFIDLGVSEVRVATGLADVPALNPESLGSPPHAIVDLRELIDTSDSVLLASPEYAGGMAGHVKNTLDWLVGSGEMYQKPVAIMSAGTSGGSSALSQMARTLTWQGAYVVDLLGVMGPKSKSDDDGNIVDTDTITQIAEVATLLNDVMGMSRTEMVQVARKVATQVGYDPNRIV